MLFILSLVRFMTYNVCMSLFDIFTKRLLYILILFLPFRHFPQDSPQPVSTQLVFFLSLP